MLKIIILGIFIFLITPTFAKAPFLSVEDLSIPPPRIIRTCCSFGSDLSIAGIPFLKSTDITSLENIGNHEYLGNEKEGNGNIYTKRGGFIDIGHLRDCADWTAYLYSLILLNKDNIDSIYIDLGTEGGSKTLTIKIPAEFNSANILQLAGKIAYDLSVWHEIATWFGASYVPLVPERYSSFSPEDLYSNLLGVNLSMKAITSDLDYNSAMTLLIANTLDSLQAVANFSDTYAAMENVKNLWWTREKSLPSKKVLLKRYLDSDNFLIPWLLPNEAGSQIPYKLNKPSNYLSDYYELQIKLNYKFPVKSIYSSPIDRTITQKDFGYIIKYVENDVENLNEKLADKILRPRKRKERKERRSQAISTLCPIQKCPTLT